jgi:hypothetical protein
MKTNWNIRNVDEIKGTPRSPLIIHMSAEQWKRVIADLEPGREVPVQAFVLTGIPDPSGDVFLYPHCPEEGPHTICAVVTRRWKGAITFECRCRPRTPRLDEPITLPTSMCALQLDFSTRPVLQCVRERCRRTCRLRFITESTLSGFTLFHIVCACQ